MRPLAFALLRQLSAENFISGTVLAQRHGVSRSAVSDALQEASAAGVEIFKLTRRGYRLARNPDWLDLGRIRDLLGAQGRRFDVEVQDVIDSTNTALLVRANAGAPSGSCLVAEWQSAGRGRRGRQWQSGCGTSLTFSVLWRFDRGAVHLGGLSLVVGLAIVQALREGEWVTNGNLGLKWPNDILVDHQKLGGVLIETQGDVLGPAQAIIGIGLNVRGSEAWRAQLDQPITALDRHSTGTIERNALLARILAQLASHLERFNREGFAPFRTDWLAAHSLQGKGINVLQGEHAFAATVSGVAPDGALMVERNGETLVLSSAEISIRREKSGLRTA